MPVELRKRPPPKETAAPPPAAKRGSGASTVKKIADKAKAAISGGADSKKTETPSAPVPDVAVTDTNGAPATGKLEVGQTLNLDGFGGTIQTHDGQDVTVKELLDKSGAGIVIFTYPRASTPGCTTQACLFRDSYAPITGASLAVYGLSTDSPKANTTFATKQKLPYPLLCDPNATLTSAIGMKKPGPGKSTTRGVVVIDKKGVLRVQEQAGPAKTLDIVLDYIKNQGATETGTVAALVDTDTKMDEVPLIRTPSQAEAEAAATAAEVGETAAKIDAAVGNLKP